MRTANKLLRLVIAAIVITVLAIFLPACNSEQGSEMSFAQALAKTNEVQEKSINTNLRFSIIVYDASGNPIRVTQSLLLERAQKDGNIYIKGDLNTSEFIFPETSGVLSAMIGGALLMMPSEIPNYLYNKAKGIFEIGYHNGSVNFRGDIYKNKDVPDFQITFKGEKHNLFFGLDYADILAQKQAMEFEFMDEVDLLDMAMQLFLPDLNYADIENTLGDKISRSSNQYQYKLTLPSDGIFDMLLEHIDKAYSEVLEDFEEEEKDSAKLLQDIYSHIGILDKWITIEDIVYSASADSEGRLLEAGYGTKVTIKIPDSDIINILTDLELFEESEIATTLEMLHGFITSSDGVKNVFEINFVIDIAESYNYSPEIDLTDTIFTPLSVELEGRQILKRVVEDDGEYHWSFED